MSALTLREECDDWIKDKLGVTHRLKSILVSFGIFSCPHAMNEPRASDGLLCFRAVRDGSGREKICSAQCASCLICG